MSAFVFMGICFTILSYLLPVSAARSNRINIFEKDNLQKYQKKAVYPSMIPISFPPPEFSMKQSEGKDWLFDPIRKKWVIITPEEWVRQNFIQYLIKTLAYPAACIAVEKGFNVGELQKRLDILVYHQHTPWMLIECKEPNIPLTDKTLQQILAYHVSIPCPYMVVTNGNSTMGFAIDANGKASSLDQLPAYQ